MSTLTKLLLFYITLSTNISFCIFITTLRLNDFIWSVSVSDYQYWKYFFMCSKIASHIKRNIQIQRFQISKIKLHITPLYKILTCIINQHRILLIYVFAHGIDKKAPIYSIILCVKSIFAKSFFFRKLLFYTIK